MNQWWQDPTNRIAELSNESWGIEYLVGIERPEGWEYAIAVLKYGATHLTTRFQNGQVLE